MEFALIDFATPAQIGLGKPARTTWKGCEMLS